LDVDHPEIEGIHDLEKLKEEDKVIALNKNGFMNADMDGEAYLHSIGPEQ